MHSNLLFPNFEIQYFQPESYSDVNKSVKQEPPQRNFAAWEMILTKQRTNKRLQPDRKYFISFPAAKISGYQVTQKLLYVKNS